MFRTVLFIAFAALLIPGCRTSQKEKPDMTPNASKAAGPDSVTGFALVNGHNMYYEIHGSGAPLVLIHGGGSTIQSTFGRVLDSFVKDWQVIAVELQGHGHTPDIDRPETFEQDADDVAALLEQLKIENADFLGFSNGGNTTLQIAMRHPGLMRRMVLASTFFKRDGLYTEFWQSLGSASLEDMPQLLKDAYIKAAPDSNGLVKMFTKDKERMLGFKDWKAEAIHAIPVPAFILVGDQDVIRPEHAVEMFRLLPKARLSIIPGGHGAYIGEVTTGMEHSNTIALVVSMIREFLSKPSQNAN